MCYSKTPSQSVHIKWKLRINRLSSHLPFITQNVGVPPWSMWPVLSSLIASSISIKQAVVIFFDLFHSVAVQEKAKCVLQTVFLVVHPLLIPTIMPLLVYFPSHFSFLFNLCLTLLPNWALRKYKASIFIHMSERHPVSLLLGNTGESSLSFRLTDHSCTSDYPVMATTV